MLHAFNYFSVFDNFILFIHGLVNKLLFRKQVKENERDMNLSTLLENQFQYSTAIAIFHREFGEFAR